MLLQKYFYQNIPAKLVVAGVGDPILTGIREQNSITFKLHKPSKKGKSRGSTSKVIHKVNRG